MDTLAFSLPPARRWISFCVIVAASLAVVNGLYGVDVGYRDFSYGLSGTSVPTGEKPESNLWWNDGSWWGSLYHDASRTYHTYQLNTATQTWTDTGTVLDNRPSSKADTVWDNINQKLYVASHVFTTNGVPLPTSPSQWGRLYRFSYNGITRRYTLDAGFPVNVTRGKSETLVLEKVGVTNTLSTGVSQNSFAIPANSAIASLSPTSGPVGTVVTINGNNFTCTTAVGFNGTAAATFTVDSDIPIRATVPAGGHHWKDQRL